MKKLKFRAIGLVCATLFAGSAMAQQVTLRLHQFLPPQATIPAKAIIPWAQKVEKESGGKIKVQEDIINGLENTPQALIGLLAGENRGTRMVKV